MKHWLLSLKVLLLSSLLFATSCGQTPDSLPNLPGVKGPLFNVVAGKVIVTLNLLNVNIVAGGRVPIPKTRDSSFEIFPNLVDGGTTLQFSLDPAEIKGVTVADDPNTLPDGRPLPGVPGGVLPSLRVDTELFKTSFYFGQKLFGFFVPFKLNTSGFGVSYPIKINNADAGLLGLVASDVNGQNSGLVIFLKLSALKNGRLKQLIQESERNPHLIY